ncbi:Gfo/Idh/MocA family oxidoreductase [Litorilinea aerophila]|uniref:Gfo/Idh/MocA family oxidoreductase n=1 Tax=Litorilinea aerophila TaxID=1204385 RepID=A0A540VK46_9CHLR|nr:Gfo/Idh/MocA family oxidoreductase [Litorilinea aerophila]MCC9075219.1 Gfo/Idh/MocA family oxidoreductase [Litorilinea aerophila]
MSTKHRVAIIGCGGMSRNHIRGYLNCGRYEIVAMADLEESAMEEVDQQFNLSTRHYTDAREMLAQERPDVVSICTWHAGHATWTIAAAAFKPKAILCEKPMADTVGRAEQMMIACRRNNVKLAIAHQRRFLPAYTLARDLIAQGAIGQVQLIQSFGGAGLPNYSSHQTDMYRYLLGDDECEWVMGNIERKTDQYERNTRIEDCAVGVFQFRSGARALLLSDLVPNYYQGALIYGSQGMINLTTENLQLMNQETGGRWELHQPDGKFFTVAELGRRFEWDEAGAAQADELADWIEGKIDTHRGEAQNGYKALQMIHAIYESARCHEKVIMPLQTRLNPLDLMVESGHLAPQRPGRYDIRAFLLRGERMTADTEGAQLPE